MESCGTGCGKTSLVGLVFGKLTVRRSCGVNKGGKPLWWCRCVCGNEKGVDEYSLKRGDSRSCGKCPTVAAGEVFGKLTVIVPAHGRGARGVLLSLCKCECGNEKIVLSNALKTGSTQSCGECPNKFEHVGDSTTVLWIESKKHGLLACLVDTTDFPAINTKRWFVHKGHAGFYAQAKENGVRIMMHNFLFPGFVEQGLVVDHRRSYATLDNRRRNLRPGATGSQNAQNKLGVENKTGFKGLSPIRGKFRAYIGGKCLGSFENPVDAARAFNKAAIKLYGEFAVTNDLTEFEDSTTIINGRFANGLQRGQLASESSKRKT